MHFQFSFENLQNMSLESRYWGSFFLCAALCIGFQVYGRFVQSKPSSNSNSANNARFSAFQYNYLIIFLLAMFSDWLQGPYVYELYVSYGFSQEQIAELFVCGFGSSLIVGTFVGGLADKLGRKVMCIIYSVCYISACFTKLVPEYWTLMLGRFLSGVSTSLLFSVFESWMVCEHHKQGFDGSLLGDTFAYATFGNGLVAVVAGLIANSAADAYGFSAPFVVAIIPLSIVALLVGFTWSENYGNQQLNLLSSLSTGFDLIRKDSRIAALGLGQSCFEGAMYTFVFMWTPALKTTDENDSTSKFLGLIFAVFMVCVMIGSSIFKIFSSRRDLLYKIPLFMHGTAFASMTIITLFLDNKIIVYSMFLVFEATVGLFYPSYGVIKSEKIPEDIRSAVMNIFRIPLNIFVVVLLLKIKFLSSRIVFCICSIAHGIAFLCYFYFYSNTKYGGASSVTAADKNESANSEELVALNDKKQIKDEFV
jgi:MFS family permease